MLLSILPPTLLPEILKHLHLDDLRNIRLVCKHACDTIDESVELWRAILLRDFGLRLAVRDANDQRVDAKRYALIYKYVTSVAGVPGSTTKQSTPMELEIDDDDDDDDNDHHHHEDDDPPAYVQSNNALADVVVQQPQHAAGGDVYTSSQTYIRHFRNTARCRRQPTFLRFVAFGCDGGCDAPRSKYWADNIFRSPVGYPYHVFCSLASRNVHCFARLVPEQREVADAANEARRLIFVHRTMHAAAVVFGWRRLGDCLSDREHITGTTRPAPAPTGAIGCGTSVTQAPRTVDPDDDAAILSLYEAVCLPPPTEHNIAPPIPPMHPATLAAAKELLRWPTSDLAGFARELQHRRPLDLHLLPDVPRHRRSVEMERLRQLVAEVVNARNAALADAAAADLARQARCESEEAVSTLDEGDDSDQRGVSLGEMDHGQLLAVSHPAVDKIDDGACANEEARHRLWAASAATGANDGTAALIQRVRISRRGKFTCPVSWGAMFVARSTAYDDPVRASSKFAQACLVDCEACRVLASCQVEADVLAASRQGLLPKVVRRHVFTNLRGGIVLEFARTCASDGKSKSMLALEPVLWFRFTPRDVALVAEAQRRRIERIETQQRRRAERDARAAGVAPPQQQQPQQQQPQQQQQQQQGGEGEGVDNMDETRDGTPATTTTTTATTDRSQDEDEDDFEMDAEVIDELLSSSDDEADHLAASDDDMGGAYPTTRSVGLRDILDVDLHLTRCAREVVIKLGDAENLMTAMGDEEDIPNIDIAAVSCYGRRVGGANTPLDKLVLL